jgi:hypothetical protein
MKHAARTSSYRTSTDPPPTVPVAASLAAAVLIPLVVVAALHPDGLPATGALLAGYLAGRRR